MSNWVFDEQQGNSVSRRVPAQRNWARGAAEADGSRWQAPRLIKVDLDREVRKREREAQRVAVTPAGRPAISRKQRLLREE